MDIDEKFINYRIFEYKSKKIQVPILKISKGTLLFRYVYDIPKDNKNIRDMTIGSFLGIKKNKKEYCLPENYNVFFYPYPYIMDTNKYLHKFKILKSEMVLFEITQDINVLLALSPSKFTRISKGEENEILITCDNYSYCGDLSGFYYDPCFRKEFLEQNSDVMGIYGISKNDSNRFMKEYKKPYFSPFKKFIKFHKDINGIGVPELILYPRKIREEVYTNINPGENVCDIIIENYDLYNYKMIDTFTHKVYDKKDELYKFMNTQLYKDYNLNDIGFYVKKKQSS